MQLLMCCVHCAKDTNTSHKGAAKARTTSPPTKSEPQGLSVLCCPAVGVGTSEPQCWDPHTSLLLLSSAGIT